MAHGESAWAVEYLGRKCLKSCIALDDKPPSPDRTKWINIARVGQWKGHAAGEFEFTEAVFDSIISNAEKRRTPINCDYEHDSRRTELTGLKPSSGAILQLVKRANGQELWALVRLTPKAARAIREEEIRSCSPVVAFDSHDRVTDKDIGPELLSLALTNDPFLDGLHPIELTRIAAMSEPEKAMADEPKKDDADTAPPEDKKDAKTDDKEVDMADEVLSDDSVVDAQALVSAVADATGVSADAALGIMLDKIDAISKIVADNSGDGTTSSDKLMSRKASARLKSIEMKRQQASFDALTAKVESLEASLKAEKTAKEAAIALTREEGVKTLVEQKVKDGYVPADGVADAIWAFTTQPEAAARIYARKLVPIGDTQAGIDPPRKTIEAVSTDGLSDKEKRTVKMMTQAGIKSDRALKAIGEERLAGKGG